MLLHDAALGVEHEGSGKRSDAAILEADFVAGQGDGIVDAELGDEVLDGILIVIIHHQTENLEAVLVFVLEGDEVGNFGAARAAPGGPEIQENDSAMRIGEGEGFAIEASKLEAGGGIGVTNEADGGLLVNSLLLFLGSSKDRREEWKPGEKEARN